MSDSSPGPGWYPDPMGASPPRYWDGAQWTSPATTPFESSPRRKRIPVPIAVVIVLAVAVITVIGARAITGGSGSKNSASIAPAAGSGYVAEADGYAMLLQWTTNGRSLSGSGEVVALSGSAPAMTTTANNITVAGTIDGDDISLSFNGGTTQFGTIADGRITLNFAQSDGTLLPITFSKASTSQFNRAVVDLQNQAQGENATYNQQVSQQATDLANECTAAGGQPVGATGCDVATITDRIDNANAPTADYETPPSDIAAAYQECGAATGSWGSDPFGGYVVGQTGQDCTVNRFEDAVVTWSPPTYVVPIGEADEMGKLLGQCNSQPGSFSLDTARSGDVFACFVGNRDDDVILIPEPHYANPLPGT